uniref:Uncharacterized protein n=1 Tax=Anguilla anguilla TaxID=7936 RepID=A0A0E9SF28_ANGAN
MDGHFGRLFTSPLYNTTLMSVEGERLPNEIKIFFERKKLKNSCLKLSKPGVYMCSFYGLFPSK